jgi:hypothetical protein
MSLGTTDRDRLAYDLAQSDFDAVERDGYRAEWTADNTAVVVRDQATGDELVYDGEDLVRAASDQEVQNARNELGP